MATINEVKQILKETKARSAWTKGVKVYALELMEELEEAIKGGWVAEDELCNDTLIRKALLNGADNWSMYSWGGCSLIYNADIAERLCTPSELKRTHGGAWKPNKSEEWLDTQARALYQAQNLIIQAFNGGR